MKAKFLLEELIENVLQEISTFGLSTEGYNQYRRTYDRIKEYASKLHIDVFCEKLLNSYRNTIEIRWKNGEIAQARFRFLKRTILLLEDYSENGTIKWKIYVNKQQPLPVSWKFKEVHTRFIEHLQSAGRSYNTIVSAKNITRQFLLFLEDCGCYTLTSAIPEMVPQFFQHLLVTYSSTSIRTVASHVRSFLQFVEAEELLRSVPVRCTRKKSIIPILSEKENEALWKVLKPQETTFRDKAIILLAWQTGLRACDILKLQLHDIDWINDTISITQSKTGKAFKLPLTTAIGNALSAYIINERPIASEQRVFLRSQAPHKPLSDHAACYGLIRRAFINAGIRLGNERRGTHLLRHSAASNMLAKGVPITTISSMLGHSDKTSTDMYLTTDIASLRICALSLTEIPMNCRGLI